MNRREFLKVSLGGIVIGSIPLISGCSKNPLKSEKGNGINIYFLKNEKLTFADVVNQSLSNLELYWKPWIASDDIRFYDWSSHLIYLKKELLLSYEGISTFGKPFVMTANEEICYLGALMVGYSSYGIFGYPSIYNDDYYSNNDIIHISFYFSVDEGQIQDKRDDLRIKDSLIKNNQFHAGIKCTLNNVRVLNINSVCSVEYNYTLQNLDEDNLYVLDSDKMGTNLFHYYAVGVVFKSGSQHFWSQNRIITPPSSGSNWMDWHTKIESGKSLTRTVQLEGYPQITSGEYNCNFVFPSCFRLVKDAFELSDGRIWLGSTRSSDFILDV